MKKILWKWSCFKVFTVKLCFRNCQVNNLIKIYRDFSWNKLLEVSFKFNCWQINIWKIYRRNQHFVIKKNPVISNLDTQFFRSSIDKEAYRHTATIKWMADLNSMLYALDFCRSTWTVADNYSHLNLIGIIILRPCWTRYILVASLVMESCRTYLWMIDDFVRGKLGRMRKPAH